MEFLLGFLLVIGLAMAAWICLMVAAHLMPDAVREGIEPKPEPAGEPRHQHEFVIVHVRGCAHDDPGPFCRQCGEKVDGIGISCIDCGQCVVTMDGPPARYETEEAARASLRFVGLNPRAMTDQQLRDTIREMEAAGIR